MIFNASVPAGGHYDPWKSASDVRVLNWGAKISVNGYIGWQEMDFTGMTRYKFYEGSWDDGTSLTRGEDFKVDLSQKWGELRIPLSEIGCEVGEKVGIIYAARHSAIKQGYNDTTPYLSTSVSDWANSSAVIYSTNCYVYRIQSAMITAMHIPSTSPISGWGSMRNPLTPSSCQTSEIMLEIYPSDLTGTFYLKYSTDSWITTNTKTLNDEKFSGAKKYIFARIPSCTKNTTVKYYFDLYANGIRTYVCGGSTYSLRTADINYARNNSFSFTVLNSSPSAPLSVSISPSIPTTTDDLTCEAQGAQDPDSDALTYIFEWFKNGVFISSQTDASSPYTATLSSQNTTAGEEWFCRVKVRDSSLASSDYTYSETLLISSQDWQLSSQRKNEAKVENGEFLFSDKTGETSDPYFDIEEFRLKADENNLYVRIKLLNTSSKDNYQFALTFSTKAGGNSDIGDDSGVWLGNLFGENLWEREVIFHSTTTGSFTAEVNDGVNWNLTSGVVNFYENSGILEAQIPRSEVGLISTTTFKISLALFKNSPSLAQNSDTTLSGAIDVITISSFTLNDSEWQLTTQQEDLSDSKLDFFSELKILSTGTITNSEPQNFSLITPSGTITDLSPYFDWQDSSDSDGGITSYIIEIATSLNMDGSVLYRVNTSTSEFHLTEDLTGLTTYFWRAGARDGAGEITFSTTWYFYISVSKPVCSKPFDDLNTNNYGKINGDEDMDGNVYFWWPPATDPAGISEYEIAVSTDSDFSQVFSSNTTTVESYTFNNLPAGYYWYARVRAKNNSGIWGEWSDVSDGIYVNRKKIDGDTSDWQAPSLSQNSSTVSNGDGFWQDKISDPRTDKANSSQLDLSTFAITCDRYNLYFYLVFASTVGSFGDGRHFIEIAVDNSGTSSERVFIGRGVPLEDTYVSGSVPWEYIVRIRSGQHDVTGIDSGFNTVGYGTYTANTSNYLIEGAIPLEKIGGSASFLGKDVNFTVAVFENDGSGNVAQYGADNSNIVDVITSTGTWDEVKDGVVDFYISASFNENGEVSNITEHSPVFNPPPNEPISGGYSFDWPRRLVIYYLNVDRFYNGDTTNEPSDVNMTGGDFKGIIQKVDYFNELGVNMIYTMPIDYFGGGVWGYNHSDIYRIQDSYGDYQKFVEMAKVLKRRNIKIAIDWVPGQVYQGRTYERHPEIFYGERFGAVNGRVCQRMADAMEIFANNTRFWVGLGVDAFRVDNPKFYPDDISLSHLFFRYWRRKIDVYKPDFWDFGEVPDNDTNVGSFVYNGDQLHGMQNFPLKYDLRNFTNNDACADLVSAINAHDTAYGDKPVMQTFENNHDEDRIYHYIGDDVNVSPWRLQPILFYMLTDRDPPV